MKISQKEIYDYLIEKGLSHNHALGMIANIKAESSFNVGAEGDGGKSFGLFQHYDERRDSLLKFINDNYNNKDWKTNWRAQIDFALQEDDGKKYKNQHFDTSEDASEWFTMNFERPYTTTEKRRKEAKSRLSFFESEGEGASALKYFNNLKEKIEKKEAKLTAGLVDRKDISKVEAEIQSLKLKYVAAKRINDAGVDYDFNTLEANIIKKDGEYIVETKNINKAVNEATRKQTVESIAPEIQSAENEITDIVLKLRKWERGEIKIKKEDLNEKLIEWRSQLVKARSKHKKLLKRKNLLSTVDDEIKYFDQQINNIEWTAEEQKALEKSTKELTKNLPSDFFQEIPKAPKQKTIGKNLVQKDAVSLQYAINVPWGNPDEVFNKIKKRYKSPKALQELKEMYAKIAGGPGEYDINLLQKHLDGEGTETDLTWKGFQTVSPGDMFRKWEANVGNLEQSRIASEYKKWETEKEIATKALTEVQESDEYTDLNVKEYDADVELTDFGLSPQYTPLSEGVYQDDEGNLWRKGTEGGWQVKYNRATQEKGAPIGPKVDEFGQPIPGMQIEYDYQDDWTTFDKNDPLISNVQDFENQLTPFTGSLENLPSTTTTEEEAPLTNLEKAGRVGESLLKGAGAALDYIGGPGAIISYIMGKKGLKEAMKEVKPQASAELSPMFMQHLRQTRELAKKGFHPDQAQKFRKELDGAYQKGLENAVRGSGGQRARFLAQSGVLDAQRSSALLDYAVKDEELQEKNKERYEKMMLFKENFDIQQTEKERAEDMARQVANKKAAAGFTSAAFTNLLSGFGRSSLVPNPAPGTTNLYDTIANWGKTEQTTQE